MDERKIIEQSQKIAKEASQVLKELQLFPLWQELGCQPYLVGALAYGLAMAPDIDMEIFCKNPKIEDGFEILKRCAGHPGCLSARFRNEMLGPDQGYYWGLKFQQPEGRLWKFDMWSLHQDHPGPTSRDLIEPMLKALDEDKRLIILELKKALMEAHIKCPSIYLYQAVLADSIHNFQGLKTWLLDHDTTKINDWHQWMPGNNLN